MQARFCPSTGYGNSSLTSQTSFEFSIFILMYSLGARTVDDIIPHGVYPTQNPGEYLALLLKYFKLMYVQIFSRSAEWATPQYGQKNGRDEPTRWEVSANRMLLYVCSRFLLITLIPNSIILVIVHEKQHSSYGLRQRNESLTETCNLSGSCEGYTHLNLSLAKQLTHLSRPSSRPRCHEISSLGSVVRTNDNSYTYPLSHQSYKQLVSTTLSATHRVLNIVEVLEVIFDYLRPYRTGLESPIETDERRQALARAARTCKSFSDLALKSLWWELDGLDAILSAFTLQDNDHILVRFQSLVTHSY